MPAHLLYGDSFLVSQALKGLQGQVGEPEVLEANSHRLSGGQLQLAQLQALCSAVPFLAEHRLIIVEDLLSLFDSREGRRRPTSGADRAPSSGPRRPGVADWEALPPLHQRRDAAYHSPSFPGRKGLQGNALLKMLRPVAQVQEFPHRSEKAFPGGSGTRQRKREAG